MIGALFAAQAADVVTFLAMVRVLGPGAEANPLVRELLGVGVLAAIGAKLAALALALAAAALLERSRPRLACSVLVATVAAGVAGAIANLVAIDASLPR